MNKAIAIKEAFEKKITVLKIEIQHLNDLYLELEKENNNKTITLFKYEQNKSLMNYYQKRIDKLVPEIRTYREALYIINNILEAEE